MPGGTTLSQALIIGAVFLAADLALLGIKWLVTRLIRRWRTRRGG
jgi:hypothetical protein